MNKKSIKEIVSGLETKQNTKRSRVSDELELIPPSEGIPKVSPIKILEAEYKFLQEAKANPNPPNIVDIYSDYIKTANPRGVPEIEGKAIPKFEAGGIVGGGNPHPKKVLILAEAPKFIPAKYQLRSAANGKLPEELRKLKADYDNLIQEREKLKSEYTTKTTEYEVAMKTHREAAGNIGRQLYEAEMESRALSNDNKPTQEIEATISKLFKEQKALAANTPKPPIEPDVYENKINGIQANLTNIVSAFYNPNINPKVSSGVDKEFEIESNNIKNFYKRVSPETKVEVYPFYVQTQLLNEGAVTSDEGIDRIIQMNLGSLEDMQAKLADLTADDKVVIMGHSGSRLGGVPVEDLAAMVGGSSVGSCYLGSCTADKFNQPFLALPDKDIYYIPDKPWWGFNPNSSDFVTGMFSRQSSEGAKSAKIIPPVEGTHYQVRRANREAQ